MLHVLSVADLEKGAHKSKVKCATVLTGVQARCLSTFLEPLGPHMDKPLKTVANDQCDVRPTVTFPTAALRRLLIGAW